MWGASLVAIQCCNACQSPAREQGWALDSKGAHCRNHIGQHCSFPFPLLYTAMDTQAPHIEGTARSDVSLKCPVEVCVYVMDGMKPQPRKDKHRSWPDAGITDRKRAGDKREQNRIANGAQAN